MAECTADQADRIEPQLDAEALEVEQALDGIHGWPAAGVRMRD